MATGWAGDGAVQDQIDATVEDAVKRARSRMPWPVEVGAAGRCARTGEVQLIADVAHDPDYVPGNDTVQSEYIVPIRHRVRLHGVLNLESTQADFFTPEVRAMFDAVALQIAGTIHLARVVRELELANRKLERLSMSDGLTGIANRRCFDLRLTEEWQRHAALVPRAEQSPEVIVRLADEALYRAKAQGRDRVCSAEAG